MEFFPTDKVFLALGSLHITWYAILSLTGAMVAYFLSVRTLKKMGYSESMCEDYFITMLPLAYIGARIWYVIFEWQSYVANPISVFYIWEGGLAIHGGLIAAIIYGYFFLKKRCIDPRRFADACLPNVMLGQVIGRWGNFVNQEAYGSVVSEAYFKYFPDFITNKMYIGGEYRVPTFLYEGVGNLIGFLLITFVYKKYGRKKRGDLAYAYLLWYGLVRFFVEGLRTDSLMIGPLRTAQLVSIVFMVAGLLGILGVYDKMFKNIWPFKKQKPVILFDLDGTLVDTEVLIAKSFEHVFKLHKPELVLSKEDYKYFLGPTLKQSFEKYLPELESEMLIKEYREFNHEHHDEYIKVFDGAQEVVKQLHDEGYDIGVVSNKLVETVTRGLDFCGMRDYFEVIIGCDDVQAVKPSPEGLIKACGELHRAIDNVIYVGDSCGDIQTCKNMSAFSVGVLFDEDRAQSILDMKPCATIKQFSQLIDLLKEDYEWSDNTTV